MRLKALYLGGDSPRFVRILAHRGEEWRSVVKGYLKVIAMCVCSSCASPGELAIMDFVE